ncbi:hypothetical protein F7U66_00505 [Vibrio parahaemolyticus]|nr:hypothetical protein [Vibrio parahaemolyticus]
MLNIIKGLISRRLFFVANASTLLSTATMSFLTVWLLAAGYSMRVVFVAFAALYMLASLPLFMRKSNQLAKASLLLSSAVLPFSSDQGQWFAVSIVVYLSSMMVSRDLFYTRLMSIYEEVAESYMVDIRTVIATAMVIAVGVSVLFSPILGMVADRYSGELYLILGACGLVVSLLAGDVRLQDTYDLDSRRLPLAIHRLGLICFFANTALFFVRYMMMPLLFVEFATFMGLRDDVFTYLGVLIALMTVISFLFNAKPSKDAYVGSMFIGVMIALSAALAISSISMAVTNGGTVTLVVLFVFFFLLLEMANKIWTVNFIAQLTKLGKSHGMQYRGFKAYAKYKAFGGVFGFGVAYLMYGHFEVEYISFMISLGSMIAISKLYLKSKDDH